MNFILHILAMTIKLSHQSYSKEKCIKPEESSEVRAIIGVLSFTFQVRFAYESNFGIDYIKYAGNIQNSSILGIYSTLSRYKMVYFRWESFRFIQGL